MMSPLRYEIELNGSKKNETVVDEIGPGSSNMNSRDCDHLTCTAFVKH